MDYTHLKQITLASAIAVACTMPVAEDAWAPVFAKYDGVDGESADAKHKGEIDVLSWSWGMSDENDRSELPCVEDFRINKYFDSATPGLIAFRHNQRPSHAVVTVERDRRTTLVMEFKDIKVKEMHFVQKQSTDRPVEEVRFDFSEMVGTYTRLPKSPDGSHYPDQTFVVMPGNCR